MGLFQGQLVLYLPTAVDWLTISSLKLQDFPGDWLTPFYPPHLSPPGTLKITYLNQDFTLRALLISPFKLSLE